MNCPEVDCKGQDCGCRKPPMNHDQVIDLLWWQYQERLAQKPGMTEEEAFTASVWPVVKEAMQFVDMGKVLGPQQEKKSHY